MIPVPGVRWILSGPGPGGAWRFALLPKSSAATWSNGSLIALNRRGRRSTIAPSVIPVAPSVVVSVTTPVSIVATIINTICVAMMIVAIIVVRSDDFDAACWKRRYYLIVVRLSIVGITVTGSRFINSSIAWHIADAAWKGHHSCQRQSRGGIAKLSKNAQPAHYVLPFKPIEAPFCPIGPVLRNGCMRHKLGMPCFLTGRLYHRQNRPWISAFAWMALFYKEIIGALKSIGGQEGGRDEGRSSIPTRNNKITKLMPH